MNVNDVIIKPVISEKTTGLMDMNKYVFRVALHSNKKMIKQAIKQIFDVTPEKINVMRVRGKKKRVRYQVGRTTAWKKAIITLKDGDRIEIFDGQK